MKKKIFKVIFLIIVTALLFAACGNNDITLIPDPPDVAPSETVSEVLEFFPFKADTLFVYQGYPDERFSQLAFAGFIEGNMMQRLVNQGAVATTEVFKYEDGELRLTFGNPVVYDLINVMDEPANLNFLILKAPLAVGNSWSMTGDDTTEIVSMDTEVETPFGIFTAMRVVTTYSNGDQMISYFARGIGLVRRVVIWSGQENSFSLLTIVENTRAEMSMPMFRLDEVTYDLRKEPVRFSFATNDDVLRILGDVLKTEGENHSPLLTPNTRINEIVIDTPNSLVTLDVSGEFISELDLDVDAEETKLQMLANTIGNFFATERFIITVDGGQYRSSNVEFPQDAYITVERIEIDDVFGFGPEDVIIN